MVSEGWSSNCVFVLALFTQNTPEEGKVSIKIDPTRSIAFLPRAGHSDDWAEYRKTLRAVEQQEQMACTVIGL
jgi:peptidase E